MGWFKKINFKEEKEKKSKNDLYFIFVNVKLIYKIPIKYATINKLRYERIKDLNI